jgi:hypothetical protein
MMISTLIEKRITGGYGQGTKAVYKPWILVQNIPSKGRVHRIKGWKHGRVHHLLSDLERNVFLHYQWPHSVIDIREQFPLLPLEETVEIAKEMGVRHPTSPHTKHPIVMTTDLLLTKEGGLKDNLYPRTVKYFHDLQKLRTLEKLEIERRYWAANSRGLTLKIVTDQQISKAFVRNMLWVHPYYWLNSLYPFTHLEVSRIANVLARIILNEDRPLHAVAQRGDRLLRLEPGTSLAVIRYLLANRYWEVDMYIQIRTNQPLILVNAHEYDLYSERSRIA